MELHISFEIPLNWKPRYLIKQWWNAKLCDVIAYRGLGKSMEEVSMNWPDWSSYRVRLTAGIERYTSRLHMEKSKTLDFILLNPKSVLLEFDAIFGTNYHISLVKLSTTFNFMASFSLTPVPHSNSDSSCLKSIIDFSFPSSCLIFYIPRFLPRLLLCSCSMLCVTDFIQPFLPFN